MVKRESWKDFGLYNDSGLRRWMIDIDAVAEKKDSDYVPEDFVHFDQMHYCRHDYIKPWLQSLGRTDLKCLELGCGIGGSARMAAPYCKEIYALDYVEGLVKINDIICKMCGMDNIKHLSGDACTVNVDDIGGAGSLDLIFSIQVFYHIADKKALFDKCFECLKPGGVLWIEDFGLKNDVELTNWEKSTLLDEGCWFSMLDKDTYVKFLKDSGFEVEEIHDRSKEWSEFVFPRAEGVLANKEMHLTRYGQEWWDSWCDWAANYCWKFYSDVEFTAEELKEKFPHMVATHGEEEIMKFVKQPQKTAGYYIKATKPSA